MAAVAVAMVADAYLLYEALLLMSAQTLTRRGPWWFQERTQILFREKLNANLGLELVRLRLNGHNNNQELTLP